jgi:chitodextrinase
VSRKKFGHPIRFFIILAMLSSYIIFYQVSAFDPISLLPWTTGYGITPYRPDPILAEILNNPPKMPNIAEGPANGIPATSYSYSTIAVDPDGDQLKYTFDWGDETKSTTSLINSGVTASASHIWSKAGKYEIKAMATDSKDGLSQWSASFNVTINTPPVKPNAPSGPISGRPGATYNYTASSIDADQDQMSYTFNWGDGTESITGLLVSGAKASANHSWKKAGTYWIMVAAIDERGASSAWSEKQNVTINTPPDRPSEPSGAGSIYAWAEYAYSSFASDPDGDEVELTFDWGDGNISRTDLISSGSNASAVHSWSSAGDHQAGDYQIRVIAKDIWGAASNWSENWTINVVANNRPNRPRELFGPGYGYRGIAYSYFTMAKDIDDDNIMLSFDWGDGTTSTTDMVESGCLESLPHTWVRAGKYQIKANATDSKGASSGWTSLLNVTIGENNPPNSPIIPAGPTSGRSMVTYRYATSASDPDGDPVKYVFDWGDKTTSWTGLAFIDSGKRESVSHKWSQAGTYQVKAMALDDKGAASGWSNSLLINISS